MNDLQELAAIQIAKHGADRYPTPTLQALKLVEEVGELVGEMLKNRTSPPYTLTSRAALIGELADTALALASLANKLGADLSEAVKAKVEEDTRRFGAAL